jgi:hypothetical protein
MNREERCSLLEEMFDGLTHREAENLSDDEKKRLFLPLPIHALALRPEKVVVRGGRGAGKSALFGLLRATKDTAKIRAFFGDDARMPDATWLDAFSESASYHPQVSTLDDFAGKQLDAAALRTFWSAHLLKRLTQELQVGVELPSELEQMWYENMTVERWFPTAANHQGDINAALDEIERHLEAQDRYVFATYDHLDRIGTFDRNKRGRYASGLLALWLSLSNRYRHLRAKIFLREDLFEDAIQSFPDATKLRPRSVSIDWEVASLYRVVVRHMANRSESLRGWLQDIRGLEMEDRGEFGWMPGEMREKEQKAFAKRLAGELMGKGPRKGYTFRWIPNRLQDAQIKIVPRSILCLLGFAAEAAKKNPLPRGFRLIQPADLHAGLEPTSKERVNEIAEEYPIVRRLENLRNAHVMMDPRDARQRLSSPIANDGCPDMTDGDAVIEELVGLGVLSIRPDSRIDVPDIYRYGFGIKRKGGVKKPK